MEFITSYIRANKWLMCKSMNAVTISSKGRITIPSDVRRKVGLRRGDRLRFVVMEDGSIVLRPATRDIRSIKGMVPRPDSPVSLEPMELAIRQQHSKKV